MLAVAGTASLFSEGPPRRIRPSQEPTVEEVPIAPGQAPKEIKGLGGTVDNSEAKIVWGGGIKDQGSTGWQPYVASQVPEATPKAETSKAFDLFNEVTGEAISDKTMDTLTVARIRNPLSIYGKLKTYVDQAKDYDEPRVDSDIEPDEITSRTIQLAVPEYTSPRQWLYLNLGIGYGRRHGVSVVITRIRE
jgi:filamentous hemagglutinin